MDYQLSDIFRFSDYDGDYKPEYKEAEKEVISLIKKYNLSMTNTAVMFRRIIHTLGGTPINDLSKLADQ